MKTVDVIRNVYGALARGDVPAVLAALDPAIRWTEAEGFPYGGTYIGPDAVLEGVLTRLGTEWDGFQAIPDEFIDGGDAIVALGFYRGTYRATGRSMRAAFAHVWHVRDNKAVKFVQYVDTRKVAEALPAAAFDRV
jgi:ketosteroid isomerase-like protein